ncbi:50S ribosomal protein L24e [Natronorubrum sp. DTA28]|uniref:50S ribosomal protein L24e n=1 Tax=Natronorubrum sp. DTA28 TaxID=3447019 RepID=UPI003F82C3BE
MVEKRTCDYTGEEIEPGTGIMYVRKNGSVLHFVDSKAEKNYKLGREPRDLEWTEDGRRNKGRTEAPTSAAEDDEQDEVADAEADDDLETEDEAVDEDDDSESAGDEDVTDAEADDDGEAEAEETEAEQ